MGGMSRSFRSSAPARRITAPLLFKSPLSFQQLPTYLFPSPLPSNLYTLPPGVRGKHAEAVGLQLSNDWFHSWLATRHSPLSSRLGGRRVLCRIDKLADFRPLFFEVG